ncbi:MAG: hypothetical protein WHX53_15585, partial [Anaerolineae bacterium]
MRTLLVSLTDHPMAMLRGIAALRGVELNTNNRDEAAAQLAAALAEPEALRAGLAACSEAARAAWAQLAAAGGRMKAPAFTRAWGAIRPVGPGRLEREALWQQPQSPAEELWYRGLIFRGFADLGDGPAEYVYIPTELMASAPAGAPATPTAGPPPVDAPAHHRQTFNTLAVDLCTIMAALREQPARVDRSGQVTDADLVRLREGLLVPDPLRLQLALILARGRGWLALDRDRLVLNSQAATAWLRLTPWEQMTSLFEAWRDSPDPSPAQPAGWNDLRRVPTLQAEGAWRNDPLIARRAILDALARLEPERWYALADFVAWIKATNPDFQRPDGVYAGWYLRDAQTGRYLS